MKLSDLMADQPRDDSLAALAAMFDSFQQLVDYAKCGEQEFMESREKQDAIMYRIICAGEAAKRFYDAYEGKDRDDSSGRLDIANQDITKVSLSDEQWKGIISMRDALAHKIDEQDLPTVWRTVSGDIPLMIPPVLDAIKNARMGWFADGDTNGRLAARRVVNEEIKEFVDNILASLKDLSVKAAKSTFDSFNQTLLSSLSSMLLTSGRIIPEGKNEAEVAEEVISSSSVHDDKLDHIARYLEQNYDEDSLEGIASDEGPRAIIDDVYVDYVNLDEETGIWEADLVASVHYEDNEGDTLWSSSYKGSGTGSLDPEGEVVDDEINWEMDDSDSSDSDEEDIE